MYPFRLAEVNSDIVKSRNQIIKPSRQKEPTVEWGDALPGCGHLANPDRGSAAWLQQKREQTYLLTLLYSPFCP